MIGIAYDGSFGLIVSNGTKRTIVPINKSDKEIFEILKEYLGEEYVAKHSGKILTILGTLREAVFLNHISRIEDPSLNGRPIVIDLQIASTSITYVIPSRIIYGAVEKTNKNGEVEVVFPGGEGTIDINDLVNLKLIGARDTMVNYFLREKFGIHKDSPITVSEYRTAYYLHVRPPASELKKKGKEVFDAKSYEYKTYSLIIVTDEPLNLVAGKKIRILGTPVPSPKDSKLVIFAWHIDFPEEKESFSADALMQLKAKLDSFGSLEAKVDWILENFERYSGVVKRRNVALATLLTYFSPLYVEAFGKRERGWMLTAVVGDTTTGKSETVRLVRELLDAGLFVSGEAATQAGLVGTATQVEGKGWFIDWGYLPLMDSRLLSIDGVHKLPKTVWASTAEALREGMIDIAKAARARANCRTRTIFIANPLSESYTTKDMNSFIYPVLALATIFDVINISRLDLAVFTIADEVKPHEIRGAGEPDPDFYLFREVIRWAWSNPEVEITQEALDEIVRASLRLYEKYFNNIVPLVTIDMRYKIARLAIALATLTMSTDMNKVIVTEEHVRFVEQFLDSEYSRVGLDQLAKGENRELTADEFSALVGDIAEKIGLDVNKLLDILRWMAVKGNFTRDEILQRFGIAEKNQLRPLLSELTGSGLIERKRGFVASGKLIKALKKVEQREEVVKCEVLVDADITVHLEKGSYGPFKKGEIIEVPESDFVKLEELELVRRYDKSEDEGSEGYPPDYIWFNEDRPS
jgi:hypothetical protein